MLCRLEEEGLSVCFGRCQKLKGIVADGKSSKCLKVKVEATLATPDSGEMA